MALFVPAVFLLAGGCVFFQSPLSDAHIGPCDMRINGVWKPTSDDQLRIEFVEIKVNSDCSVSRFLVINREADGKQKRYEMHPIFTTLSSGAYINLYSGTDQNSDEKARYFIAKYSFASDDTLVFSFPDYVFVSKAIKGGEIEGDVTQGLVGRTSVYGSIMQTRKLFHVYGSKMFDRRLTLDMSRVES